MSQTLIITKNDEVLEEEVNVACYLESPAAAALLLKKSLTLTFSSALVSNLRGLDTLLNISKAFSKALKGVHSEQSQNEFVIRLRNRFKNFIRQ